MPRDADHAALTYEYAMGNIYEIGGGIFYAV